MQGKKITRLTHGEIYWKYKLEQESDLLFPVSLRAAFMCFMCNNSDHDIMSGHALVQTRGDFICWVLINWTINYGAFIYILYNILFESKNEKIQF